MGTKRLQLAHEIRKIPELPPVFPVPDHAAQTGIRPAQRRHAGCQGLHIGQSLGLAGGCTDEQVAQLIPLRHLLGRHHAGKDHLGCPKAQISGLPLQLGTVGTIPHQQQRHSLVSHGRPEAQQFVQVLLRRQPSHGHQHQVLPGNIQRRQETGPASRNRRPLEAAQVDAAGHHEHRRPHTVALEQRPHLAGGSDHAVRAGRHPPGQRRNRPPPQPDAGGKVVGIILIHRMIGVDQRHVQLLSDPPGQEERGELTLGMDHVRSPLHQLPDPTARQGRPQPDAGIHQPRRHGPDPGHTVLHGGVQVLGEGQHPDLVSPQLQFPPQIQYGGHHPVHRRAVPIGCNQNLHSGNASLPLYP